MCWFPFSAQMALSVAIVDSVKHPERDVWYAVISTCNVIVPYFSVMVTFSLKAIIITLFFLWFVWLPNFKHLVISCPLGAGATCLYFPQKEYIETVYVGQQAGTPILQVHAMRDDKTEKPHFYLCPTKTATPPHYSSWFYMNINTGTLFLNKTLEESDFAQLCELDTRLLMVMHSPISVPGIRYTQE